MSKSFAKFFLVIFFGTLSLGFSSVAKADLSVQWLFADKKLDCPSNCKKTGLKYAVPTGIDQMTGKPSFYICVTYKDRGWQVGFNKNGENSCISVFDDKAHHGTQYYCQCTNNPRPQIFL